MGEACWVVVGWERVEIDGEVVVWAKKEELVLFIDA